MAYDDFGAVEEPAPRNEQNREYRRSRREARRESTSDTDGVPNGQYGRTYDPLGRSETAPGIGLGIYDELELNREQAERDRRQGMLDAQERIKLHNVGKFIVPRLDNWESHARLVENEGTGLYFDAKYYKYFDGVIASTLQLNALTDKNDPEYAKYEPLRVNLAVLRNSLYAHYMKDGTFDPEDAEIVPKLQGIASEIGKITAFRWQYGPYLSAHAQPARGQC